MLSTGYQAVVFVLLACRTSPYPVPTDPDEDQPLIDRLDEYVQNVHNRVIQSTGYERLRVLVNASGEVLQFFKLMGYLLLNGTLGECVHGAELPWGIECVVRINVNRSRFGDEVAEFLAKDRDESSKDIKNFPLLVLPVWELGSVDAYLSHSYLKEVFSDTWTFVRQILGRIADALPADIDEVDWYDDLPATCSDFSADVTRRGSDETIKALIDLVGPTCDNLECSASSWLFKDKLQRECETFADEHGFNGGTSNRCLHKFIVRYNNYSAKAYETFVGHVAKYLYWDTMAHGLCLSVDDDGKLVNVSEAARRKTWVLRSLANIGDWLLEVDAVLAETPPAYWIVEAKPLIENAIGKETVSYPSSADAWHFYKRIHDRFQSDIRKIPALRIKNLSDAQTDVMVYYPGYDSTEHCYQNMTNVILSGQFSGVNYVVSFRQSHVPSWIASDNATMERDFRDSQESDQCERIADVDRKMENKLSGRMRAVVAVKCAKRFVWYELGYQYFHAAYTEAPALRIKQESTYNTNCGMLVLFP